MTAYAGLLHRLARRWNRQILLGIWARSIAISVFAAAAWYRLAGSSAAAAGLAGSAALLILLGVFFYWDRRRRIDAAGMARHLNRVHPELEESSALLLRSGEPLSAIEGLQRRRLLTGLEAVRERIELPRDRQRRALAVSLASLLLALLLLLLPADFPAATGHNPAGGSRPQQQAVHPPQRPPEIESAVIEIIPPRYTRRSSRRIDALDLEVAEGAEVTWHISTGQALASARIIFSDGDSLDMTPDSPTAFAARRTAQRNAFYSLELVGRNGRTTVSDFHKLQVIPDRPAAIAVQKPGVRTVVAIDQPRDLDILVRVEDDYGVADAHFVATVTRGSGEAVQFREETHVFDNERRISPGLRRYEHRLHLSDLSMVPGDELYFHVVARDNREPEPNLSRSETFFVILQDTSTAPVLVSSGLAVNPIPAYFRSQRQIIIDTEKLIAEQNRITPEEFKNRSNNLGIDQKSLRLRYGQFLGEEFETGASAGAFDTPPPQVPDAPDEGDDPAAAAEGEEESDVIGEFGHSHDAAENATLFAESIREQLKASLAEMWDAELKLRTHVPKEALPYEYRALVLLKNVQQRSRAFVQRVGFDPPPLEPDKKRLSGDLSEIDNRRFAAQTQPPADAALRLGLAHLNGLRRGQERPPGLIQDLETAGQALAREELILPGRHLRALQNLRRLIDSLKQEPSPCLDCIPAAAAGFWRALPEPVNLPQRRAAGATQTGRRYLEAIGLPE